jgi:hypothetical protein
MFKLTQNKRDKELLELVLETKFLNCGAVYSHGENAFYFTFLFLQLVALGPSTWVVVYTTSAVSGCHLSLLVVACSHELLLYILQASALFLCPCTRAVVYS